MIYELIINYSKSIFHVLYWIFYSSIPASPVD